MYAGLVNINRPGSRAPGSPVNVVPDTANPSPPFTLRNRRLLWGLGAAVVAIGLLVPNLAAPASGPHQAPDHLPEFRAEGPGFGGMLLRLVGGTVFVLALSVATFWACRRWLGPATAGAAARGRFETLESIALGLRCRVHLVRAGDRHLLVGLDAGGLKALLPVEGTLEPPAAEPQPDMGTDAHG
jgi:flagellar biogenesis protein FliO